jgi:hypothetical protein
MVSYLKSHSTINDVSAAGVRGKILKTGILI